MSKPVTPTDAAAYLARWAEVGAREAALARAEPIDIRFKQLCAMFDARHLFPADVAREQEATEVRGRWRRLRESLRGD
jgi:hypothetical protein